MVLLVIFLGVAIVYYLFQKNKISRMEKQEYLQDKKNEKFEQLLDLARKQDTAKSEEEKVNKSNNLEN
jgi:FtsZ-interacting cell division protein ZipA